MAEGAVSVARGLYVSSTCMYLEVRKRGGACGFSDAYTVLHCLVFGLVG